MVASVLHLLAVAVLSRLTASQDAEAPFAPNIVFNWTTSVVDPINLWYFCGANGFCNSTPPSNNWVTTFDESPSYVAGIAGMGKSHTTGSFPLNYDDISNTRRLSVNTDLAFTKAYVYGTALDAAAWKVDEGTSSYFPPLISGPEERVSRLIARTTDPMMWGLHTSNVSWTNGDVTVDSIVYTMGMKTQAPSFDKAHFTVEYAVLSDGSSNLFFDSTGLTNLSNPINLTIGGAGDQEPIDFPHVKGKNSYWFSVPHNTSFVVVNGTVGPDHGRLDVSLRPWPLWIQRYHSTKSAYNPWVAPATLFVGTLDPSINYSISLGPGKYDGPQLGLHSATFYSYFYNETTGDSNVTSDSTELPDSAPSPTITSTVTSQTPPTQSDRPKVAPIVGGVIGGLGAILLVGALIFLYFRYARQRARLEDRGTFIVDVDGSEKLSPYVLKGDDSILGTRESQVGYLSPGLKTQTSSQSLSPLWASPILASGSSPATPDSKYTTGRSPVDDIVVQHEDGGHINVEHVPPCYNPEWVSPTSDPDSVLASGPARPPGLSDKEYMAYLYDEGWPHAGPSAGPSPGPSAGPSSAPSAGPSSPPSPPPAAETWPAPRE